MVSYKKNLCTLSCNLITVVTIITCLVVINTRIERYYDTVQQDSVDGRTQYY